MLWRDVGMPSAVADIGRFIDGGAVSSWAWDAMGWAVANDVMRGSPDGALFPHSSATRAEIAVLIHRISALLPLPISTPTVIATSTPVPTAVANTKLVAAVVSRVIDGDTIQLATGERVRFIGVDAPEVGMVGADEATQFVRDLVLGRTVWLEADGNDKDIYGRLRRYIWLEVPTDTGCSEQIRAHMLNAMLLERGLASVMIIGAVRHEGLFRQLDRITPLPSPTRTPVPTAVPTTAPEVGKMVWVSGPRTGTAYHSSASCSNMSSPIEIHIDDVGGRTRCLRCW